MHSHVLIDSLSMTIPCGVRGCGLVGWLVVVSTVNYNLVYKFLLMLFIVAICCHLSACNACNESVICSILKICCSMYNDLGSNAMMRDPLVKNH